MKELFEKIYIKSEADLPKEEGWYICGGGHNDNQLRNYYWQEGQSSVWEFNLI